MLSSSWQPPPRAAGAWRSSSSPERCTARTCRASHPRPRPRCEPRGTWLCSTHHVPPSPAPGGCFFSSLATVRGWVRAGTSPAAGHNLCSGDVVVAMRKGGCFPRGGSEGCKRDKLLREEASAPRSHPGPCTPCLGFPICQAGSCLSASCQSIPGNWVEKSAVGDCRFGRCPQPFSGRQG